MSALTGEYAPDNQLGFFLRRDSSRQVKPLVPEQTPPELFKDSFCRANPQNDQISKIRRKNRGIPQVGDSVWRVIVLSPTLCLGTRGLRKFRYCGPLFVTGSGSVRIADWCGVTAS